MVGDGGDMAPLRLQQFLTGNDQEALGPVTAGFGPAVNSGEEETKEMEELRKSGRRHTGNFNFDLAVTKEMADEDYDELFNPGNFDHLDKKPVVEESNRTSTHQ